MEYEYESWNDDVPNKNNNSYKTQESSYQYNNNNNMNEDINLNHKGIDFLPTYTDQETVATIYHRKNEQQNEKIKNDKKKKKQKKKTLNSLFKRTNIFPDSWYEKSRENNSGYTQGIDFIISFWQTYKIRFFFSIICTGIFMFILYHYYGPRSPIGIYLDPSITHWFSDSNNIPYFEPFDLLKLENNNPKLKLWFENHINPTITIDFENDYFISEIYNEGKRNISFNLLKNIMRKSCPNDTCLCISSLHFGIPNNIIFLNNRENSNIYFLINPIIQEKSAETFIAKYNEEISMRRPKMIIIEYCNNNGQKSRDSFIYNEAACLMQCIEFYYKYIDRSII